jgi:hypothetical protein
MNAYFAELIKDKRIAVVGPAATITDSNQGTQIDSYDLVVRLNWQWPVPDTLVKDVGQRMDILYHCSCGDACVDQIFYADGIEQLKAVLYSYCDPHDRHKSGIITHCTRLNIPHYELSREFFDSYNRSIRTAASTGLIAICHLLEWEYQIRELYVTGFTFHTTPYHDGYHINSEFVSIVKEQFWDQGMAPVAIGGHNIIMQLAYLGLIVKLEPRIVIDSTLRGILEQRGFI